MNPYSIEVSDTVLSKLSFSKKLWNYIYYSPSYGACVGDLYQIDKNAFDKINQILQGNDSNSISKGDKAFALPGSNITNDRLKTYLKSIGATLTKDIDKATVIIGSNSLEQHCDSQQPSINTTLAFNTEDFYTIDKYTSEINILLDYYKIKDDDRSKIEQANNEGTDILLSPNVRNELGYCSLINTNANNYYFVYPNLLNIIYNVLSKKLPVISQDYITENANSGLSIADADTFNMIKSMLNGNADDKTLAVQTLIHSKFETDNANYLFNIWQLAINHYYDIECHDLRYTKNHEHFMQNSLIRTYRYSEPKDFIKKYKEWEPDLKNQLDVEKQKSIIKDVFEKNDPINAVDHEFFDVFINEDSYTIKLKDKWIIK